MRCSMFGTWRPRKVAAQNHAAHPQRSSKNVVENVGAIRHFGRAGHRRTKRTDDRPRTAPGSPSCRHAFRRRRCACSRLFAAKKEAFFASIECATRAATDPVTQLIAYDCAQDSRQQNPAQRQNSAGPQKTPALTSRESPGRKKPTNTPVSTKITRQTNGAPPQRISSFSPSGL